MEPWACPRCGAMNGPSVQQCTCRPAAGPAPLPPLQGPMLMSADTVMAAATAKGPRQMPEQVRCRCPSGNHSHIRDARLLGECPTALDGAPIAS